MGGHASMPEIGVDPIVVGAAIVMQLQTIVSRNMSAKDHAVVSVTEFETDGARNILASQVVLRGDCRGFTDQVSGLIKARMVEICHGVAGAYGAKAEVGYSTSFHPLVNDPGETETAVLAASQVGQVDKQHGRVGFSEDFAEFLTHRPGAFVLMGNGMNGANAMPLHNPGYDFNDDAIRTGVDFWKAVARSAS